LQKLYDAIRKAHDTTVDFIEVGVKSSEIYNVAKNSLEESGYAYDKPLVGHGTGICVHEGPHIGNNDITISLGIAFTIEIILKVGPGSWIGIEDMIVCDKHGFRDITSLTKDLVRI